MESDEGLFRGTLPLRNALEEAAAIRWYLERRRSQSSTPDELLEYRVSTMVLQAIERSHLGLRRVIDEVGAAAELAAALAVARKASIPGSVISELEKVAEAAWHRVTTLASEALDVGDIEGALAAYAEVADITGVVTPRPRWRTARTTR